MHENYPIVQDEPQLAELKRLTCLAALSHNLFDQYAPLENEFNEVMSRIKVRYLVTNHKNRIVWLNVIDGGRFNDDLQFISDNLSLHRLAEIFFADEPASPYGYQPHSFAYVNVCGLELPSPLFGEVLNATFVINRPTAHEALAARADLLDHLTAKVGEDEALKLLPV